MAVREILKMGDPRLLRVAEPVREFGSRELDAPAWPHRRSASTCSW
jgi:peptide deformylase